MASGDIRNACQCLLIPSSLGRYFSLTALSARAVGLVGRRVQGRALTRFPASLLVGFSWSMYFCQDAALRIAAESGIPPCIHCISDRSLPVLLSADQDEGWSHCLRYIYADNFGLVSNTEANATEAYNMIAKAMFRVGLRVHDEVRATRDADTLGVRLRFDTGVATVSIERGWRLRSVCREFCATQKNVQTSW